MSDAIRVLVVDEDRDVRELTSTFLEREDEDLSVETATGGDEALERIAGEEFDAVVSDYRMPGMDGLELAEELDERDEEAVFVLFTAADDPVTANAVDEADIDAFVLKGSGTDHYAEIVSAIHEGLST